MPVHERKRGAHDKPATNMQFFLRLVTLLQSHPASLTLPCVLLFVESNKTVTVTVSGHTDLAGSTLMVGVDNRLAPALHCKGNVTVTSAPLGGKIRRDGIESCLCMFGDVKLRGRNMRCDEVTLPSLPSESINTAAPLDAVSPKISPIEQL